jgi:hypothetical protein
MGAQQIVNVTLYTNQVSAKTSPVGKLLMQATRIKVYIKALSIKDQIIARI